MLTYPAINPVAFNLGLIQIHWYGLMYLFGFIVAWGLAVLRAKRIPNLWNKEQISDLLFYGALGVIGGGRLGYIFFYDFEHFIHEPWVIIQVWQGGMSFHGGLLGVIFMLLWYSHRRQKNFLDVMDFTAPLVPLGLAAGRLGNFINGELWGRVTNMPWGMIFPHVDDLPRHPSQLYAFGLEGILLFLIVWLYSAKPRPRGAISAVFLMGYGSARFIGEFFRQPDSHLGFVFFDWLTMGQLLSFPMIIGGIGLFIFCVFQPKNTKDLV